jgi:hypothetical protein
MGTLCSAVIGSKRLQKYLLRANDSQLNSR